MDPLDGPIAGLVEGDTFIQTPLFRGLDSPIAEKGSPNKSIALDLPKGPWEPRGPWAEPGW